MISYDLALQLKKVGFPQDEGTQGYYINEADKVCFTTDNNITDTCPIILMAPNDLINDSPIPHKAYVAIVPTLSELIEACGNDFGALKRYQVWKAGDCSADNMGLASHVEGQDAGHSACGQTPEEAVAKLYLRLHKGS